MNWLHFFLWIAGLYALYYLIVVLIDLAGSSGKPIAGTAAQALTFSEHVAPVQLQHQPVAESADNKTGLHEENILQQPKKEVITSGGVSLSELFSLARKEAIIYTNSVSY